MTKTKFSRTDGLPYFLTHGAPPGRALPWACIAPLLNNMVHVSPSDISFDITTGLSFSRLHFHSTYWSPLPNASRKTDFNTNVHSMKCLKPVSSEEATPPFSHSPSRQEGLLASASQRGALAGPLTWRQVSCFCSCKQCIDFYSRLHHLRRAGSYYC